MDAWPSRVKALVGLADCCELQAAVWAFPDESLARAWFDGRLAADACACLADAGADAGAVRRVARALEQAHPCGADEALAMLRGGHSRLFLVAGERPAVYPYEGPFLYAQARDEGMPALFATRTARAVEACMRSAGVAPVDVRTEPVDSVWNEFSFLSYLYGALARACADGAVGGDACARPDAEEARRQIRCFWDGHGRVWLKRFMERVAQVEDVAGCLKIYTAFALLGCETLDRIEADVRCGES